MTQELYQLVSIIKSAKAANQFHRYIDFIQFPFYRNIQPNSKITFGFPLTVFVGQNGCGKSSVLHAVQGATLKNTPYKFWFDTQLDPIIYYDDERKRHSFWYSFRDEKNRFKEVIKARIKRGNDPNYWETSRPLKWAGMKMGNRSKPIDKHTIYVDFRQELSAFDKFFYFGNVKGLQSKNKQEYIRYRSILIKNLFYSPNLKYSWKSVKKNSPLELVPDEQITAISFILGRKYNEIRSVLHSLFRGIEGYSILMKTDHAKYSEAFAGSGELSVIRLVTLVLNAPIFSLIVLDEPEVSLHPGAQERLKIFLLNEIKRNKHQVVIATHSPTIVKGLPKESIKVFSQNLQTGMFFIKEDLYPEEAFFHIEHKTDERIPIIVEDALGKEIVEAVLEDIGDDRKNLFKVEFTSGGAEVIIKNHIPFFSQKEKYKEFVLLDGDKKFKEEHCDWQQLSARDSSRIDLLLKKIKEQTGCNVNFYVDGGPQGGNQEQKITYAKKYLDFYLSNVFYLPKMTPEEIIWDKKTTIALLSAVSLESEYESHFESESNFKERFSNLSLKVFRENSSKSILKVQKVFIKNWIKSGNSDYIRVKNIIEEILTIVHK
jgi:predicted ATPase